MSPPSLPYDVELVAREPSDPGWSRSDGKVQRTRDSTER
jgi:hypothetical protein